MIARAALVLTAVLVLAWVAVLLRDYRLGRDAEANLNQRGLSDREVNRELKRLDDAELLNPDVEWKIVRGSKELIFGRRPDAARTAEELVRVEPENLQGWAILQFATEKSDPALSRRAAVQVRRLDPLRAR
jgi:hypothetical protein